MSLRFHCILLAITIMSFYPAHVTAELIGFTFTGTVDDLDAPLENEFSLNESVIGSFVVDESNPTYQPSRTIFPASDLKVTIGGDYILTAASGSVIVHPGIWYLVSFSGVDSGITGPPVGGNVPSYFDIQLNDDNNVLPLRTLPRNYQISSFGWDRSNINFFDGSNSKRLDFNITSIQCTGAVPEPSGMLLLCLGALGLLSSVRSRRK
jgi:hypothetical protein